MAGMPLRRYCEEWWRSTHHLQANGRLMSPGTLVAAYQAALHSYQAGEGPARPVGHLLASLPMAGWQPATATSFVTREGWEASALQLSPAAMARLFSRAVGKEVEARAESKVLQKHGLQGEPGCIWWEVLQSFTASKSNTALEKHVLISVLDGSYPTRAKLKEWGYLLEDHCQEDGVLDSLRHRALDCTCVCVYRPLVLIVS